MDADARDVEWEARLRKSAERAVGPGNAGWFTREQVVDIVMGWHEHEEDTLTAQHEATVRELGLVKQNERLAIQALTEAQREIERLTAGCPNTSHGFHCNDQRCWIPAYGAQVRAIYDAARVDVPDEGKHELAVRIMRLATPPASQPCRHCRGNESNVKHQRGHAGYDHEFVPPPMSQPS